MIGWGLWRMAVASEHPMAYKHFELIFILPALVYLVPVALTLYATAVIVIKGLVRQLRTPHDPSAKSEKEL